MTPLSRVPGVRPGESGRPSLDPGRQSSQGLARDYADLCLPHLRCGTVGLVLVGGWPGTAKSTVAGLLADRTGSVLLSSDVVRRELSPTPRDEESPGASARSPAVFDR